LGPEPGARQGFDIPLQDPGGFPARPEKFLNAGRTGALAGSRAPASGSPMPLGNGGAKLVYKGAKIKEVR